VSDPLSQFRKDQPSVNTISKSSGKRPYEAFDKTGKPSPYTEIRCVTQSSQSPQSRFFMAAVFSSDFDSAFTLIYSFLAVEVRGQHLAEIRRAIQQGHCEFIQEFHENEFLPLRPGQPVIESIRFITGEKLDDILASHKAGR